MVRVQTSKIASVAADANTFDPGNLQVVQQCEHVGGGIFVPERLR